MQSFMPIHFFVLKIRTIENGFADPKRFRDFLETGPWTLSVLGSGESGPYHERCVNLFPRRKREEPVNEVPVTSVWPLPMIRDVNKLHSPRSKVRPNCTN